MVADTSQDSGIGNVVLLTLDTPFLEEVCLVLSGEMYINPTGEYHYGCISGITYVYI
jgi:hypothetical protein